MRRLRTLLTPFQPWRTKAETTTTLFVHEDDWAQIEVLPASCQAWCNREMDRVAIQSERSALPKGAGWSDLTVRDPAPTRIGNLKIASADVIAVFTQSLPLLDSVATGTYSSGRIVSGLMAFGFGNGAAIIITPDHNRQHIGEIVLSLETSDSDARRRIISALAALPPAAALLLVDWPRGCNFLLSDQTAIDRYIGHDETAA